MSKSQKHNTPMSVRIRLLNLSRAMNVDYMKILVRYLQERLLYRIAISDYQSHLLLKGSALLYAHQPYNARPTVDIDFLGHKWRNNANKIRNAFEQICLLSCAEDGVLLDTETIRLESIAIEKKYPGFCVTIDAHLDTICQPISVDICFGDVVTPAPVLLSYPALLDEMPQPKLWAYSLESSIAEKFHAMIERDSQNSRMKDFFDVYTLLNDYEIDEVILKSAIRETFRNRGTHYSEYAALYSTEFATDPSRVKQWNAFLKKIRYSESLPFMDVVSFICKCLKPYWTTENIE